MMNMTDIRLVRPTMAYQEDILKFRQELLDFNDADSFAGCSSLEEYQTAEEWIHHVDIYWNEATCPSDKAPADVYLAVRLSDDKIVGIIDFRHHINNPVLSVWGGHIGYSVRPCERRKGYAKEMLRQILQICKDFGLERVMITCHRGNEASEKTILANGGVFEKEVLVDGESVKRYWITLITSEGAI